MLQKREFRLKFLNATVKFIPEVVGGKEVYSVLNAIDEHCSYITEELLDTILKLNKKEDVENNIINLGLDVYSYSNKKPSILSKKIIIDSTLAETLPDIQLSPVTYTKEAKPLTIKVEGLFCIQNFGKNVSIDFNQDTISCKSFSCTNKEPIDIKIDINTTSTLFEYINFSNFSVLDNRGNEINIHINTDGDYIKMEDLIFKSYRTDYTGPFQVSLDSGDGDLSVCQSEMALSVEEAPTEKDYCKISSSKRGIKIFKSFVSLLYPDSSLKVEKGIDLVGADVFVYGNNEINGNLKFDGDIKARGTLKMVHLKSYSSLQFQTRNCGFFDLTDSILNNGKKKIIFKRGETCLNTVNLENEGKSDLTFDTVDIRDSKLTNISDLHSCNIANTEVLNFTLNPYGRVFSFGPTKEYPKNGFHNKEDKEIFCSLKNISVELGSEDSFIDKTKGALHLNNSIVKGATVIETTKDKGGHSLSINNCILNDANISLARNNERSRDVATEISNSEISKICSASGLKAIRNSIIVNGNFNRVYQVEDSVVESVSLNGRTSNTIRGYNSNGEQENLNVGQAANELEIL